MVNPVFILAALVSLAFPDTAQIAVPEDGPSPGSGLLAPVLIEAKDGFIDVTTGHAAPYVMDYDGDGRADLLVGDYQSQIHEAPLTDEQVREKARWEELRHRLNDLSNRILNLQRDKKPFSELEKRRAQLWKEYQVYKKKVAKFPKNKHFSHGWVWLYLRQP